MKYNLAGAFLLMFLFFQCSMNFPHKKPLIHLKENQFIGSQNLSDFLMKLDLLQSGKTQSVRIIHIGDSHIQMGYFSGEIRKDLQAKFSGTGIGFFFPNSLCGGYNPIGLKITSTSKWECDKITNLTSKFPIGITGLAMQPQDSVSNIHFAFSGREQVKTFAIFHQDLHNDFEFKCENAVITTKIFSENACITTFTLQEEISEAVVEIIQKNTIAPKTSIYAVSVNSPENEGINYNTFGVSGGQYKYFSRNAPLLIEQITALQPDLVIISLGSNDSYAKGIDKNQYREMVISFVRSMKAILPNTNFILTTPPDTEYDNQLPVSGNIVYTSILEAGKSTGCTVWDFYKTMGGLYTNKKWKELHLANKDGLHLTTQGYYLQGALFNYALSKAYEEKFNDKAWHNATEKVLNRNITSVKTTGETK